MSEKISVEDLDQARKALEEAPPRPRERFVHPDDKRHLQEHDGGTFGCARCHEIWRSVG